MEYEWPLKEEKWRELKGRCISCGYLGKRSLYYDEVYEANTDDRSHYSFVSNKSPISQGSGTEIWCFVNEVPLNTEFRRLQEQYGNSKDHTHISWEVVTKNINCPKWIMYQQFMSPKEHFNEFKERKERRRTNRRMTWLMIAAIIVAAITAFAAWASIYPDHWLFNWLH